MAIILAAAFLRWCLIWRYPVGFHFDEAANVIDLWRLGRAFHPIYFEANNGREPFYFYWAWPFIAALGGSPQALRLSSTFLGIATIPAVYFCIGQLLRRPEGARMARRIGLFAAAACAFLFMHLNFSRIGLRTISLPLAECVAFGLLWLAFRKQRLALFALAGLVFAGSMYTYTAARLLVPALAAYGAYYLVIRRRIRCLRGVLLFVAAFLAGAAPLAAYALSHQAVFFQRTQGVAITDPHEVWQNLVNVLQMFVIRGSVNGAHNVIGMPLFDWPMRVAFVVGLVLLLIRIRQPEYVFLLLWLGAIALASIFSPDAPYYIRLTALIPPAVAIPALALAALPIWLRSAGRLAVVPSLAVVAASGVIVGHEYFQVWAPSNDTYFWMMQDKVDAGAYLGQAVAAGSHVFLAPLYAQDWTFEAVTRGQPIQSFDASRCWVVPPAGKDAVYTFPPYDVSQPALLLPHLPPDAMQRPIVNDLRQPVLIEVRVPGSDLPPAGPTLLGSFGGVIGLSRVDGLPTAAVHPGQSVSVTLVWQSLAPTPADYTAFVHADDNVNQLRAQQDHFPCDGSFPTSRWTTGEQVFDHFTLSIPASAPSGTYDVTTGLYSLPGPRNLDLEAGGADLNIGSFEVRAP